MRLERRGIDVLGIEGRGPLRAGDILKVIAGLGISSVLVEGGARTIRTFLEEGLVNKMYCFVAPKILGSGLTGLDLSPRRLRSATFLRNTKVVVLGPDLLVEGTLK